MVTQLLDALSAMSMTWSPARPGNWLFHCHFALHNSSFPLTETPDDPGMRDMVGLVLGTIVAPRRGVVVAGHPAASRHLRLVAELGSARGPNGPDTLPVMHFVLEEHGQRADTHADVSPELDLVRGEPVAITIVNHLDEPTSVHWHGIEVEDSYMDGAPGFSGEGQHLSPAIAPGDSFIARFTPTRSGTFMYHAHMDEMREELAGLEGMLIVRDSAGAAPNDYAFMLKGDPGQPLHPLEINGRENPDTLVLRVGHRARFRFADLSKGTGTAAPSFWLTARPDSAASIAKDTMLVHWQPVAKDGFDLPASARSPRVAQQVVSVGETFDFEYTPTAPGTLRLEVRTPRGQHGLLLRVPIRVEGVAHASSAPVVRPNPNTARAGVLHDGVLAVALEAKESQWYLDGRTHPPMTIEAFAEPGKDPLIPGPLIRAPQGTELRLSIHNSLRVPLTLLLPAAIRGGSGGSALDSLVIEPGALGLTTVPLAKPGSYPYRASTPTGASRVFEYAGLLAGAIVVDSSGAPPQPHDRVLVLMLAGDSVWRAFADTAANTAPNVAALGAAAAARVGRYIWTINGNAWPATERVHAMVGDSLHWRIVNATPTPHPMHLHGFYYRIDQFAGPLTGRFRQPRPGQMVVTQLMSPFSAMSITWSPTRAGNWLFHCHFAIHNTPISVSAAPDDSDMRGMTGLVVGVEVSEPPGVVAAGSPARAQSGVRRLRLVAEGGHAVPGENPDTVQPMRFVLDERSRKVEGSADFSPELDLVRGEPVAITIVNHLGEPTAVHWHGIELDDSYMDGVPGFSGEGTRLTPQIAPGDSFVARFTPPRAGTFMYHAHVDDVLQQAAGMEGALIVRDRGAAASPDDHVFFLKGVGNSQHRPLEINGRTNPDTVVLHVGRTARLRVLNLTTVNVAPAVLLTARPDSAITSLRDTMLVSWTPIAKDGFDVPSRARTPARARQIVAQGETYDYEYTPQVKGHLHLEFRTNGGQHRLLMRVPIRVE